MTLIENNKNHVKTWLQTLLQNENLDKFEYEVIGNSEKGDGYMGDIVFIEIQAIKNSEVINYSLVLKCSKSSEAFRKASPVQEAFLNEIYFYNNVLPSFQQFQQQQKIQKIFNEVPKYYGSFTTDKMEIIALENLKTKGYVLWDRTTPVTRHQINMIVEEYANFHSVSIAMSKLEPNKHQKLINGLQNIFHKFINMTNMIGATEEIMQEVHDILVNDLDKKTLQKWLELKTQIRGLLEKGGQSVDSCNVITHGDCWSNNFMHQLVNGKSIDSKILDWQLMAYTTPIFDLSYFLLACLSEEDIQDLDTVIKFYYNNLEKNVSEYGLNLSEFFSWEQFINDWKRFSLFGFSMSAIIHKFSLSENDDVPDMTAAAERGEDLTFLFKKPIQNVDGFRKRMKYIVLSAAKQNLI